MYPLPADEVSIILSPSQNVVDPTTEMVGIVIGFMITVVAAEVPEQRPEVVTV